MINQIHVVVYSIFKMEDVFNLKLDDYIKYRLIKKIAEKCDEVKTIANEYIDKIELNNIKLDYDLYDAILINLSYIIESNSLSLMHFYQLLEKEKNKLISAIDELSVEFEEERKQKNISKKIKYETIIDSLSKE